MEILINQCCQPTTCKYFIWEFVDRRDHVGEILGNSAGKRGGEGRDLGMCVRRYVEELYEGRN